MWKRTETTLYYQYRDIKRITNQINYNYSNYINKDNQTIEYVSKPDHMLNMANSYIYNKSEYVEFKSDFTYNRVIWERTKIIAGIVDKSKHFKIDLDFYSSLGGYCLKGNMYNITLNGVNFTTIIEYDMKIRISLLKVFIEKNEY